MGVSGVGKTTIGLALAERLGYTFLDADAFHDTTNRAKMASGRALTDTDRMPWLDRIHAHLIDQREQGSSIVLACSALKKRYRDILFWSIPNPQIIWLDANTKTLQQRMGQRSGHFMPLSLLQSQCDTLETPEEALRIDANQSIESILQNIIAHIESPATAPLS